MKLSPDIPALIFRIIGAARLTSSLSIAPSPTRCRSWPSLQYEDYFEETGDSFATLDDPELQIAKSYDIEWFPTYLLLDAEGRIVHMQATLSKRDGERRLIDAIDGLLD